jgi:hydroxymethylglutaryl-CoA synthase
MKVGIESLGLYVPRQYLDLSALAEERGVAPEKFPEGLGQERMAVPAPDEDVVTMGANAAVQAIEGIDLDTFDTIIFATESGIDQSKAAAIYVHRLLNFPSHCRTFEVKQACCSSTAALQMSLAMVAMRPKKRILIIAADVARYGIETAGEPTQGAGAIAMVISADPKILAIAPEYGSYTEDVMDFWRPNYKDEALVDGKYSIKVYLNALTQSWQNYQKESDRGFGDFDRFCYHLPFTKMGEKAHFHLGRIVKSDKTRPELFEQVSDSLCYNRIIGNCYTASLYTGLLSMLEQSDEDLSGKNIGMFSYGSGCMGSFFGGTVTEGYREHLFFESHRKMLEERRSLSMEEYLNFYQHQLPVDGSTYEIAHHETGRFRLAGMEDHKRLYARVEAGVESKPVAVLV